MKAKIDIFKNKPWKDQDEYFVLTRKYRLYGDELEKQLKLEQARTKIPYPMVRPLPLDKRHKLP